MLEKLLLLVEEQARLAAAGVPNISDGVIGGTKGPHSTSPCFATGLYRADF